MIYLPLLHNITLLVSLCLCHGLLLGGFRRKGTGFSLLSGLAFGTAAILAMLTPLKWHEGVIFDGRSIVLGLSGLFGGPVAGLVAGTMAGLYRVWLGGVGATVGVLVVAEAVALGIGWHVLRRRRPAMVNLLPLLGLGFLVHLVMLALMVLLPGTLSRSAFQFLSIPVLVLYPLGFTLLGRMFVELEKHFLARKDLAESKQESDRRERVQSALYRITRATLETRTPEDLYRDIHWILGELLPARNFYIAVQDPATGLISFPYYVDEQDAPPPPRKPGLSLTDLVLRSGAAQFLDAAAIKGLEAGGGLRIVGMRPWQWLGVPLSEAGRTIGVMAVQSYHEAESFVAADVELFRFIATQISSGIQKKHLEMLHRTAEEKFSTVFQAAPVMISLSRRDDGTLIEVNDLFCRTMGVAREDLVGRRTVDAGVLSREERERLSTLLGTHPSLKNIEFSMLRRDGTELPCLLSVEVLDLGGERQLLSMFTDISEVKRAEEERRTLEFELDHLQRLESLGRLAGGVAHDMNNILAAILSVSQVMRIQHADRPDLGGSLDIVERAAERGRDLVKALVGFTRKEAARVVPIDLNDLVRQEMTLLDRTLMKKYKLVMDLAGKLPLVTGEAGALGGALMNLCVNAVDAMQEGGTLTIATRTRGAFVEVLVADDGEGMEPDILKRAMEPFFTTKPLGKGTGLGLSLVFNTAKTHGGYLKLESERGGGTRALLGLPFAEGDLPVDAEDPAEKDQETLNILLVDDEELIRSTTPALLAFLGHRVTPVAGGREALAFLEDHGLPDLIILDMNMPDLNGLETLQEIRKEHRDLRILVATGFLEEEVERALAADGRAGSINKPYSLTEFQAALAQFGPFGRQAGS